MASLHCFIRASIAARSSSWQRTIISRSRRSTVALAGAKNQSSRGAWITPTRRQFSSSSSSIETRKDAVTSADGVVGFPIDFDTASSIEGKESQIVTIRLEPDQVLRAESGAMMYMTDGVQMNTTSGGGLSAGFQRMLTGQNIFISDYSYDGSHGPFGYVALVRFVLLLFAYFIHIILMNKC